MHLPPAAQASLGRSRSQLCFLLAWTGVYASLLGAVYGAIAPMAFAGLTLTCLVVLAHCARRWWTSPVGLLAWTGRGWIWQQAQGQQSCSVRWRADLQSFVLLELQMQQGPRQWLWVESSAHSVASWRAFRRALVTANTSLAEDGNDEADFSSDYLSSVQKPHMQASSADQGPIHRISGNQNSTKRKYLC